MEKSLKTKPVKVNKIVERLGKSNEMKEAPWHFTIGAVLMAYSLADQGFITEKQANCIDCTIGIKMHEVVALKKEQREEQRDEGMKGKTRKPALPRVKQVMEQKGISIADLAQLTDIQESYLQCILAGTAWPVLRDFEVVAEALGESSKWLFIPDYEKSALPAKEAALIE